LPWGRGLLIGINPREADALFNGNRYYSILQGVWAREKKIYSKAFQFARIDQAVAKSGQIKICRAKTLADGLQHLPTWDPQTNCWTSYTTPTSLYLTGRSTETIQGICDKSGDFLILLGQGPLRHKRVDWDPSKAIAKQRKVCPATPSMQGNNNTMKPYNVAANPLGH